MSTALVQDIVSIIEQYAPPNCAETWDNVGLQLGSLRRPVNKVFMSVDPAGAVLRRCFEAGAQLVITHHPLLFHPARRLDLDTPLGKMVAFAMEKGISIYSAHTNLDVVPGGVSAALAEQLGLTIVSVMEETKTPSFCKLVLFVPQGCEEQVRDAVFAARAGERGNYRSFQSKGVSTFEHRESSDSTDGASERGLSSKMEFVVPCHELPTVIASIKAVCPSQITDSHVCALHNNTVPLGYGCIAETKEPVTFRQFILHLRSRLGIPYAQIAGPAPATVRRVALCGGSGSNLIEEARRLDADLYITSEIKHSDARITEELGFCVLDIGHFNSEKFGIMALARFVRDRLAAKGLDVTVIEDPEQDSPLRLIH